MVCVRRDQRLEFARFTSCTHLGSRGVVPAQLPESFRELQDPFFQLCILLLTPPAFERADVLRLPVQLDMSVNKRCRSGQVRCFDSQAQVYR